MLKSYLTIHRSDIECSYETYVHSSFPANNENVVIQGYNLVRCDHPTDSEHGGVRIY